MRSLGTFIKGSDTTNQKPTAADECYNFTVTMSGQISVTGSIAVRNPSGTVVANDVFLSIEAGNGWWGGMPDPSTLVAPFFNNLQTANHRIVLIRFNGSWYSTTTSSNMGWQIAACRPSTVFQWIKDNYSAPKFNVIGSSNGGAALAYALSQYGVTVDKAIVDSGPPQMEIKKACEHYTGYEYPANDKAIIDKAYGYNSNGPCATIDTSFESHWDNDSVEDGGIYLYSGVSVHVIVGGSDDGFITIRGSDYRDLLVNAGQTVDYQSVSGMGHGAFSSQGGLDTLYAILNPSLGKVISLTGDGLDFGNVVVNSNGTGTLHVSNVGDTTLTVTSISYPTAFTGATGGFSVTAGATQDITVTFTPTSITSYSGNITVNSDATVPAATQAVSGTGIAATVGGTHSTKSSNRRRN